MGQHVIIGTQGEQKVRFQGVFTDEQFQNLPLVKQFGAFPKGMYAVHYGETMPEIIASYPTSTLHAEGVLRLLWLKLQERKWKIVKRIGNSETVWLYTRTRAEADSALTGYVRNWRYAAHGHQLHSSGYTATQSKREGKKVAEWALKHRGSVRYWISVKQTDLSDLETL